MVGSPPPAMPPGVPTAPDLLPAIDLRDGHCVRLHQGDFDAETIYDDDPVRVAREFEAAGAQWIHVVDLDAARTGTRHHLEQIRLIVRSVACKIEVGGGVRTAESAQELLDAGVERVVVGTAAVERPALVEELCHQYPGRVAVGLDARGHEVAIRGWVDGSAADLVTLAERFEGVGLAALIVTEIGRDGTLDGPAFGQLGAVLEATGVPLIASGGVGTLDDLCALAQLRAGDRRLAGIIVGRAIYEGRFDVAEGLAALAEAVVD
jgi:phosphoribosylformimino-5-aminoimidazole carboxamide ribotide isomerase